MTQSLVEKLEALTIQHESGLLETGFDLARNMAIAIVREHEADANEKLEQLRVHLEMMDTAERYEKWRMKKALALLDELLTNAPRMTGEI